MQYTWLFIIFYSSYKSGMKTCFRTKPQSSIFLFYKNKQNFSTFSKCPKQSYDFAQLSSLCRFKHWQITTLNIYDSIYTTHTVNILQVLNIEVKLQGKTKNNFWALYCCYHFYTYAHVLLLLFPTFSYFLVEHLAQPLTEFTV